MTHRNMLHPWRKFTGLERRIIRFLVPQKTDQEIMLMKREELFLKIRDHMNATVRDRVDAVLSLSMLTKICEESNEEAADFDLADYPS